MKPALKILKLISVLIITVLIILLSASFLLQDKVAGIILKSLSKNISTKLEFSSVKLSFLKKFPKASLELKDVLVHSSSNFKSGSFNGRNTDTLLAARVVSGEFKITDIIKGIYNIESASARDGKFNLYTDTAGLINYDISMKNKNSVGDVFTIDLKKINLTDIKSYYNNLATKLIINGLIKEGTIKSRISGKDLDFTIKAEIQIAGFQLYNTKITKAINSEIALTLNRSKNGMLFKKGVLSIENYSFGLDGSISPDNVLDLSISGHNVDISKVKYYLPEKYLKLVSEYNPSGILILNSKIKGLLNRTVNPHIEINCSLNKGRITYGKSDLTINNLSFTGSFSNGSRNRFETSSLSFRDVKVNLGSAQYTGTFKLSNFVNPRTEVLLKGKVFPGELKEFFNLQNISTASGNMDLDLKIQGNLLRKDKFTLSDIIDLKPEASMVFNSLDIGFKNDKVLFTKVSGNVEMSNSIHTSNFQFDYKDQKIKVDGEFINLPEWLTGRHVKLIAKGDVSFNRFIPEAFIKNNNSGDITKPNKTAFSLPDDIILDINLRIDNLSYKTFSSSKIAASLTYKPQLLTFKSLIMQSLDGSISGNGFVVQNRTKAFIARGTFNVTNIDVNKAFTTFHNFGQDFLKAENLKGKLSGSLSLLLPLDSMLKYQIKTVTAEGKVILINGALINFEPVKHLSTYIELSELENISFARLENDFFIRNNFLYVPQMDVKSSAADLSVNGKHGFDNNYEYHVKILLSEILSKKRKKNKKSVTEFGAIEDDGLGRTSLLLKVVGKSDDIKVGYDMKAAGSEVQHNIKQEKQSLKTILNQEYGWYKNDSLPKQDPVKKKSRFRITFDETDSVKPSSETPVVKKESGFKGLFKKK